MAAKDRPLNLRRAPRSIEYLLHEEQSLLFDDCKIDHRHVGSAVRSQTPLDVCRAGKVRVGLSGDSIAKATPNGAAFLLI